MGSKAKLKDKLPPHATESELSVIGSILLGAEIPESVIKLLPSGDCFFNTLLGQLYDSLLELQKIDTVLLQQVLIDKGLYNENVLINCVESVPSAGNIDFYAKEIWKKWILRRLIELSDRIVTACHNNPGQPEWIVGKLESVVKQLTDEIKRATGE